MIAEVMPFGYAVVFAPATTPVLTLRTTL
jgi:hypothetical protein